MKEKYPNKRNKMDAAKFRLILSRAVWLNYRKMYDGSIIAEYQFGGAPNTTWEAELHPDVVAELGSEIKTDFSSDK